MGDQKHSTGAEEPTGASRGKLVSLLERYDRPDLGDELVERWTLNTPERSSLRELADYVNETLVGIALTDAGDRPLDGEAANYYRLLTSDDVSSGTRIEAENELEHLGIDVDQLRADFVSRQAIHTYLTKERDVTYDPGEKAASERIDDRLTTIRRLRNRLGAVADRSLTELAEAGIITVGSTRVSVFIRVECVDCDTQYSISDLLENGGCDCASSGDRRT